MELNKIDFAKLFDTTVAIDNMHKGVTNMITYMPEQVRDSVRTVADAQFSLIRSTSKAVTQFAEVVESVSKEAQKEIAKTIEKTTKVAA
jgi:uncharacterized protein Yka (UPF0111/DUF47 family)